MPRVRISTTVDPELLGQARAVSGGTDSSLIEAALRAFLVAHQRAQVDQAYRQAYEAHPLDEPDNWGDLASFGVAVRASSAR